MTKEELKKNLENDGSCFEEKQLAFLELILIELNNINKTLWAIENRKHGKKN